MQEKKKPPKIFHNDYSALIYEKEYAIKEKASGARLIVTPDKDHVKMMLNLLAGENKNRRYSIVFYFIGSFREDGSKYQSAKTLSRGELESFCEKYLDFLETDAGHNFGIRDIETKDTVIYDNHNVLYVFGNLQEKIEILENSGYKKVEKIVIPKPCTFIYHSENAAIEQEIKTNNEWIFTPVKITEADEDDDGDKEIVKKSFFDAMFDYLEKETL